MISLGGRRVWSICITAVATTEIGISAIHITVSRAVSERARAFKDAAQAAPPTTSVQRRNLARIVLIAPFYASTPKTPALRRVPSL